MMIIEPTFSNPSAEGTQLVDHAICTGTSSLSAGVPPVNYQLTFGGTNIISDPYDPILDMDSIFADEKDAVPCFKSSVSYIQPIPRQDIVGLIPTSMMHSFQQTNQSSHLTSRTWHSDPVVPSDILSEVLEGLEDSTADPFFEEDLNIHNILKQPDNTPPLQQPGPLSFGNTTGFGGSMGAFFPVKRLVSDTSTGDQTSQQPQKRRKIAHYAYYADQQTSRPVTDESDDSSDDPNNKFRLYQAEKWLTKFDELVEFKKLHGHCQVPHGYKPNPTLARWAKRQRYQYKLFREGKQSTVTRERVDVLEQMGFVWDSHTALWEERYHELQTFVREMGHTNVPSTYRPNPKLAVWVKCQRRQYKLLCSGQASNMTFDRANDLNMLNFVWEVRRIGS